jgi:hypothetical protein
MRHAVAFIRRADVFIYRDVAFYSRKIVFMQRLVAFFRRKSRSSGVLSRFFRRKSRSSGERQGYLCFGLVCRDTGDLYSMNSMRAVWP